MSRISKNTTKVETNAAVDQFDSNEDQSRVIVANDNSDAKPQSASDAYETSTSLDEGDLCVDESDITDELISSHDDQSATDSKVADDDGLVAPQSVSEKETQSEPAQRASKTRTKADVRILKLPVIIEMQRNAARGMIVTPRGVVEFAKSDTVTTTDRGVVVFASGYSSNGKGNIRIYVEPKDPEDLQDFYNHMMLAVTCAKAGKPVPVFPWSKAKVVY